MSRIGRMPVAIPAGVTVTIAENNNVTGKRFTGRDGNQRRRWTHRRNKTERFKEDEILTRSYKNANP